MAPDDEGSMRAVLNPDDEEDEEELKADAGKVHGFTVTLHIGPSYPVRQRQLNWPGPGKS